jgi:hypothetical protein
MAIWQKRLGCFHTAVPMLIRVAHDLEEEVLRLTILGNVHHSGLIVRSRLGTWKRWRRHMGHIVAWHCYSLLFMRTSTDVSFLFLP